MEHYVNKVLTWGFSHEIHIQDHVEDLCDLLTSTSTKTAYKEGVYTVHAAPGARLVTGPNVELFLQKTKSRLVICLICDNMVWYWILRELGCSNPHSTFFNYDNFMFGPKYPTLANAVYNLYHCKDPIDVSFAPSHLAFSPECEILDPVPSDKDLTALCCHMYGDFDEPELTCNYLYECMPWDTKYPATLWLYKLAVNKLVRRWREIEVYLYNNPNLLELERMLCDVQLRFFDEGYKIVEIALNTNNLRLYKWAERKYKLDKRRLMYWLETVSNDVAQAIRN